MTSFTDIKTVLDEIGQSFDAYKVHADARLDKLDKRITETIDRIEDVEAKRSTPGKTTNRPRAEYKVFQSHNGPVYELPSHVKMADVPELRPEKEPDVSLERWLAALVAGEKCGDRLAVEYLRESKQMATTTTGVLIPQQYISDWIDLLRAQMVLNRAGMTTVTMDAKTANMSAITADPTASWHTEAGSISAANPTFAARTLTAQTLVTRCQASVELTEDSPDFGAQLARAMTGAMAAELDRVGLEGSGTPPEPAGILNTSGRSSQTGVSTLTDYEEIISGIGAVVSANCGLEQISRFAIMSPGSWTAYENLVTGISSDKTQLPRPRSIEAMQFLVTSNVAGNLSASPAVPTTIYIGDFRDLTLGIRREASIEQLKVSTYASSLLIEFVGYLRADYVVRRPASFHTIEGVAA